MKYEKILVLFVLNPEVISSIESLESQIKELTGKLMLLESHLNQ
jgi:hypothetical protein